MLERKILIFEKMTELSRVQSYKNEGYFVGEKELVIRSP